MRSSRGTHLRRGRHLLEGDRTGEKESWFISHDISVTDICHTNWQLSEGQHFFLKRIKEVLI